MIFQKDIRKLTNIRKNLTNTVFKLKKDNQYYSTVDER